MASVKEMVRKLFVKLSAGTSIAIDEYPSIRVYLSEDEHEILANQLHILASYVFYRNIRFVLAELSGNIYFITIGLEKEVSAIELQALDNIKVLSLASIVGSEAERIPDISDERLVEEVFTSKGVDNVEWDVVETFFPIIQTYMVKEKIPDYDQCVIYLKRKALLALCSNPGMLILDFENDTLKKYLDVLSIGDNNIPIDNLLHSLGSNYWKFCYVDLYRCIERLYAMAWVHNFTMSMSSSLSPDQMYATLKKFHIEKYEKDNLQYLFSLLPSTALALLDNSVRGGKNESNYIYDLRNYIVHFMNKDDVIREIDAAKWNTIVRFLLTATKNLYPLLDSYIEAIPLE